jgi:uncharacterized iron-regulated membrane protein
MALFLTVAGLTGACLAFYKPLDRWLAPRMYEAPARGAVLDPFVLLEKAHAQLPGWHTDVVQLDLREGQAVIFYFEPDPDQATGQPRVSEHDEYAFDPVSGALLASRGPWGAIPTSLDSVMSFLYALHYKLALPGEIGLWLFGIVTLLWTVDCFVGVYLTFPRGRPFFVKWKPAWRVKTSAGAYRINFDLHRAGGLWFWLLLLVFAWSSVMMNLSEEVYTPVMKALGFTFSDLAARVPQRPTPLDTPAVTFRQAAEIGRASVQARATRDGFTFLRDDRVYYDRARGLYHYRAFTSLDISDVYGGVNAAVDGATGTLIGTALQAETKGDWVNAWLSVLHTAAVWGTPYRALVSLLGVMIAVLSVTGIVIWLRKRRRVANSEQHQAEVAALLAGKQAGEKSIAAGVHEIELGVAVKRLNQ